MTTIIPKLLQVVSKISLIFFITILPLNAQTEKSMASKQLTDRGEVVFKFKCDSKARVNELSAIISIDKVENGEVTAYANTKQFEEFLNLKIPYEVLIPPSLRPGIFASKISKAFPGSWDTYPSYEEYTALMQLFASNHPDICLLDTIGYSVDGRLLLCVKISDNVQSKEAEPEFLFTSTMHGDEVTGYVLLLRLIDYMLSNYNSDIYIKELVDTTEIWINPNANPDGTYFTGNSGVAGATRFNRNSEDLNRSFPDPTDQGFSYSDGWQPETLAMMHFMMDHQFTLSANYHGGAEVMNYPWDTWQHFHPDDHWFINISQHYADSVKKYGGNTYFSNISPSGITNGYAWYTITGSHQDFTTYYAHGREITIEVSLDKLPAESELPNFWNWNRAAMLHYIQQCQYGIHGIVTDIQTSDPLKALVFIESHDFDNSYIYTDSAHGDYHRLLAPGTYDIGFRAEGYKDTIVQGVVLADFASRLQLDVALTPGVRHLFNDLVDVTEKPQIVWHNLSRELTIYNLSSSANTVQLINTAGQVVLSEQSNNPTNNTFSVNVPDQLPDGVYVCKVTYNKGSAGVVRFISIQ